MNAPRAVRAVLLTGVTGSLGGHLCAELLDRTSATAHCLVRGNAHRLRDWLAEAGIEGGERAVPVAGDIGRPLLGLGPRAYDALAESVDEVLHCAAHVNLAAGYEQLAPVNVGGTRNIIAFAERAARLQGHRVPVRYVSTLGTLSTARDAGLSEVDERTRATPQTAGQLGYPLSKMVAERELFAAAARGLPLTVFRPGVVTGHSLTGRTSASDLMVPMMRAWAALGCVPEGADVLPVDAVDVVAHSIVALSLQPHAAGSIYHLIHPTPLPLTDVFDAMRRAGYQLEAVTADQWWEQMDNHADDPEVLALAAMRELSSYTLIQGPQSRVPRIRSDLTWKALADAGGGRPPLDGPYLDRLINCLVSDGVLPAPTAARR
ncbi:thioester reductase domain-containing protein [Streptomyces sp. DG2A-72]|uniref:thioester reductase domain-containing protein n=1 Tax=Streptomyces sp. DG2A-72 TaxID=3051386 RepID=UPI00265B8B42|nr:thioester reductase domain-containing protein [Streptomyces sp. DG2A-72]MDO0938935.1 thioester reductase domain-containing protein [Streptomyces sp. DG2A-72]